MTRFSVETIEPQGAAAVHAEVPMADLRDAFDRGFPAVMGAAQAQGVGVAGAPFGFYPRMPGETVEVFVGFPVAGAIERDGDVVPFELPGGRAVVGVHVGPYEDLERTYGELKQWTEAEGLELAEGMWECYLSDPSAEPDPATWRTEIVWPLAS